MKSSKKIAVSGVLTALCVLLLFLGSLFQMLDLAAAAMGSIVILAAMIELGKLPALAVYAAASLISLLILPYKTPALVFAAFSGFYPILKQLLNRIKPLILSYAVRIAVFNLFFTAIIYVSSVLLNASEEILSFTVVFYVLGNITFIVYDFALEKLALFYVTRIRDKINRRGI